MAWDDERPVDPAEPMMGAAAWGGPLRFEFDEDGDYRPGEALPLWRVALAMAAMAAVAVGILVSVWVFLAGLVLGAWALQVPSRAWRRIRRSE